MKLSLHEIDDQIREVENRIAVERIALDDAIHSCGNSLKEAITSPKTLLTVLGVGYTVGKLLFRDKQPKRQETAPAKKAGVLGLLTGVAGTAISLAGSRWASVAKWGVRRYLARKKAAAAATTATPRTSTTVPPTAPRSFSKPATGYSRPTAVG